MVQTAEATLHLEAVEVDVALRAEPPGTLVALTFFLTETRTITTSTSPNKQSEPDHSALDKVMKLQSEHTENMKKMAEMTQQVTRV